MDYKARMLYNLKWWEGCTSARIYNGKITIYNDSEYKPVGIHYWHILKVQMWRLAKKVYLLVERCENIIPSIQSVLMCDRNERGRLILFICQLKQTYSDMSENWNVDVQSRTMVKCTTRSWGKAEGNNLEVKRWAIKHATGVTYQKPG